MHRSLGALTFLAGLHPRCGADSVVRCLSQDLCCCILRSLDWPAEPPTPGPRRDLFGRKIASSGAGGYTRNGLTMGFAFRSMCDVTMWIGDEVDSFFELREGLPIVGEVAWLLTVRLTGAPAKGVRWYLEEKDVRCWAMLDDSLSLQLDEHRLTWEEAVEWLFGAVASALKPLVGEAISWVLLQQRTPRVFEFQNELLWMAERNKH